jgi:hypothetical protein
LGLKQLNGRRLNHNPTTTVIINHQSLVISLSLLIRGALRLTSLMVLELNKTSDWA